MQTYAPPTWSLALDDHPPVRVISYRITTPEQERVSDPQATMPDPGWVFVDANGHEHRWAAADGNWRRATLPTLHRVHAHVECDGTCREEGCDGYSVALYACQECAAWVEPGYRPDSEMRTIGVVVAEYPMQLALTVEGSPFGDTSEYTMRQDLHQAVLRNGDTQRVGRAWLSGDITMSMGEPPQFEVTIELYQDETTARIQS